MGAVWENTAEKSMDGKKPQDLRAARLPLAYSRPSCRHFLSCNTVGSPCQWKLTKATKAGPEY